MLTREVVEGLVEAFLRKSFDKPAAIPDFHREMWDLCCADHKFVAIAAPRGFAKSTAVTHAYTIASIVFRLRSFVLLVADTETQATFFLSDIKKELTENDDLMAVFGIKGIDASYGGKDSLTDFIVVFNDGHRARVIAKGAGQSMRGAKWDNKRPDLIICDDLENEEMVMNNDRRDSFRRWFSGTLLPCRSKDGIVRVVGTILHTDSQLNRLMPRLADKSKPCYVDDLREKSNPKAIWLSARYRAHDVRLTKSLWPEYKPIEWLLEERAEKMSQGLMDVWAQEMLNIPYDESTAPFKRSYFAALEPGERDQTFNYYIATDFATSEKQKSDYSVFVVAGINEKGTIYILHVIQERMESPDILTTLSALIKQYKPEMIFVEKGQIWNMLKPMVINSMLNDEMEFTIFNELASALDKRSRSTSIRARMAVGAVKFDKNRDWYQALEEECLGFPRLPHDDQVDGLSLLGLALQKFVEAPTKEEQNEELYEEELREAEFDQGRNHITGY